MNKILLDGIDHRNCRKSPGSGNGVIYSNGLIATIPGILAKSFLFSVTILDMPFSFIVSEMRTSRKGDLND